MSDAPTPLPPGWYPDPNGTAEKLYWDGRAWHTASPPAPSKSPQPQQVTSKVKCFKCEHVQTAPPGPETFKCEKCGQKLVRRSARATPKSPNPTPSPRLQTPTAASTPDILRKETAIHFGVLILAGIGVFLSAFTTTTLMSGSATVWIGVALAGTGAALAFFLGADTGVRVTAAVCLAISVGSGFYIEHQLDQKRHEISKIFDSHP